MQDLAEYLNIVKRDNEMRQTTKALQVLFAITHFPLLSLNAPWFS